MIRRFGLSLACVCGLAVAIAGCGGDPNKLPPTNTTEIGKVQTREDLKEKSKKGPGGVAIVEMPSPPNSKDRPPNVAK